MFDCRMLLNRTILTCSLALMALALLPQDALAQGDGQRAVQVVARALDLDESQLEQWAAIRAAAHEAVEPLAAEVDSLQGQLEELLDGENPDSEAVGALVLAIRDLRQEIRAIGEDATAQFEALLSEEQMKRLRAIRGAARRERLLPAFRALHLL